MKQSVLAAILALSCLSACDVRHHFRATFNIILDPDFINVDSSNKPILTNSSKDEVENSAISAGSGSFLGPELIVQVHPFRPYSIERVVGASTTGTALGSSRLDSNLGEVGGLIVTADGTIVVADSALEQIRAYPPNGVPEIYVGSTNGLAGFLGDNVPVSSTRLNHPTGLTLDQRSGAIYYCDTGNDRIRYFYPGNRVYTAAGGGSDNSDSVADARLANIQGPVSLNFDQSGNLYFTEKYSGRVRKLTPEGELTCIAKGLPNKIGPIALSKNGTTVWFSENNVIKTLNKQANGAYAESFFTTFDSYLITAISYNEIDTLYVSLSDINNPGSRRSHIVSIDTSKPISAANNRSSRIIAGSGRGLDSIPNYELPSIRVNDAREQTIAFPAYTSLFIDLKNAAEKNKIGGEIYFGNNVSTSNGKRSEVAKLTPSDFQ